MDFVHFLGSYWVQQQLFVLKINITDTFLKKKKKNLLDNVNRNNENENLYFSIQLPRKTTKIKTIMEEVLHTNS